MSEHLEFERRFSGFGPAVRPEERTQEILDIVDGFMHRWGYSASNLIGAELTAGHLGGSPEGAPDLIFRMAALDYFEIVIRSGNGTVSYGGWLTGTLPVSVSSEQVNGRPVLLTACREGGRIRHVFDPLAGYRPVADAANLPLHAVWRLSDPA